MTLTCARCGFTASLDAFRVEAAYKAAMAESWKLPSAVQEQLSAYLGLFAPPERKLTGPRTLAVVRELVALVGAGTVAVDRQAARPCPPRLWAEAMAQMVGRKGGHAAHFTNHNYLRKIAYDLANAADAGREAATREAERHHRRPAPEASDETETDKASRRAFLDALAKIGRPMP